MTFFHRLCTELLLLYYRVLLFGACNSSFSLYVPVDGVLVELAELPVDGEDVHVVVLLEVVSQQVQRVFASLQPLLVLEDLLHLKDRTEIHVLSK